MLSKDLGVRMVEGRIIDLAVADDGGKRRRVLLDEVVIDRMAPDYTPLSIRLSTTHIPDDVAVGARIKILAHLMAPSGPVLPDGFDFRRQAYFQQIGAVGFTLGHFELLDGAAPQGLTLWFSHIRFAISERIMTVLPAPSSALAVALFAGERAALADDVVVALRDSGLFHLISISGVHVAIVCGVLFFLTRAFLALIPWVALHVPIKKIAAVLALMGGIFYVLLAGAPIPAQRSMLMTGLVLLAVLLDRSALSVRVVAVTAFVLLLFEPESVVGVSFQLSFAAVLAMVVTYEGWKGFADTRPILKSVWLAPILYVGGIVATTILVSLVTMPIILHQFGRVQLYGLLANAVAIPLTSFWVMPAGMASLFAMPFGWERPFLEIAGMGIDVLLRTASYVAALPGAVMVWPTTPAYAFVGTIAGLLWLALWRGSLRWMGVLIAIGFCAVGVAQAPANRPVLLLDAETQGALVHYNGAVEALYKVPPAFTRTAWLRALGLSEDLKIKPMRYGQVLWDDQNQVVCDDQACRMVAEGKHLSLIRAPLVLPEECAWADLVIIWPRGVLPRVGACKAQVVTQHDLYKGHGLWVWSDTVLHWAAIEQGAQRVWSARP